MLFFFSRSDHQPGVVWLPAFPPHHPVTWHHLLSERANEQPEIPAGDQRRRGRGLLTHVQTPSSRIRQPLILGKQRWQWALNFFKTFWMVSSTDSGTRFWNFCRVGSKLSVMNSTLLQGAELSDSSVTGLFVLPVYKFSEIKRTTFWEMFHRNDLCAIWWWKVDCR